MSTREFKMPMESTEIQKVIPHRYPFLLIDKVTEMSLYESITAIKNVSIADPILQGHFPHYPVYPGVLLLEGLAQASAVLGCCSKENLKDILLTQVSDARFRRKVIPGDTLHYHVKVEKYREPFFWFEGTATIDGELVVKTKFSALVK